MIKAPINKDGAFKLFTYVCLFFAAYVLYATYQLYQFHSHEKHLKNIHITAEFIPKELCGPEFVKDVIIIDEDIARGRGELTKLNLSVAMQDYYLGYTVENKTSKSISALVIKTDIFFPYDEKLNPMNHPIERRILFEANNGRKLESGQYFRRCTPILLKRDYSASELIESRRISKIDSIKW
jgi:hypothetical protein